MTSEYFFFSEPITVTLSFAEDIVPFALDPTLLVLNLLALLVQSTNTDRDSEQSEWTFSLHRDLSRATGENESRFDIRTTDIKDLLTVNMAILPIWMMPNKQSSKTAQDVANDIKMLVRDIHSTLRQAIPSLFRILQEGDEEEGNSEDESYYSTSASDLMASSLDSGRTSSVDSLDIETAPGKTTPDKSRGHFSSKDVKETVPGSFTSLGLEQGLMTACSDSDEEFQSKRTPPPSLRAAAPPPKLSARPGHFGNVFHLHQSVHPYL